ncbi:Uncharacterised protein [Chlamydia trachomatis]|nr:Uncharacterised protein [Chlamydia trachomatis]
MFLPECTKLFAIRSPLRIGSTMYPTGAQFTVRVCRVTETSVVLGAARELPDEA